MKKIMFSIALLTAMAASAQEGEVPEGQLKYHYDHDSQTATVIANTWMRDLGNGAGGYEINTYAGDIVIPETAPNGYTVVAIGSFAFARLSIDPEHDHEPTITSVSIPQTVRKIEDGAFLGCDLLKEITIPAGMEVIEGAPFAESGILSITIEDSDQSLLLETNSNAFGSYGLPVQTIYVGRNLDTTDGYGPFCFGSGTLTELIYGPMVTRLNAYECWRNESLKSVKIRSSFVTEIPDYAFGEAISLTDITLPPTITHIGEAAFQFFQQLSSFTIPASVIDIGNNAFSSCESLKELTIPAATNNIGEYAFAGSGLKKLTIEDGDQTLWMGFSPFNSISLGTLHLYLGRHTEIAHDEYAGRFAFVGALAELTYGPNFAYLEPGEAFRCEGLKKVTILSNYIGEIPESAFQDCENLVSVEMPKQVTVIGNNAFNNCPKLTTMNFPGVTTIGEWAFGGCGFSVCNLSNTVTSIGDYAFAYGQMKELTIFDGEEPISMGGGCFSGLSNVKFYAGRTLNVSDETFNFTNGVSELTLGEQVRWLNPKGWWRSDGLRKVFIKSQYITEIPEGAFSECENLGVVELPAQLESIGKEAFFGCHITSIDLPQNLRSIGEWAFGYNPIYTLFLNEGLEALGENSFYSDYLSSIICKGSTPATCYGWPFGWEGDEKYSNGTVKLYVPAGAVQAYRNAPMWERFFSISDGNRPTGIEAPSNSPEGGEFRGTGSDEWQTLDGRRIDSRPTQPGMYIKNGQKVIVKH